MHTNYKIVSVLSISIYINFLVNNTFCSDYFLNYFFPNKLYFLN